MNELMIVLIYCAVAVPLVWFDFTGDKLILEIMALVAILMWQSTSYKINK